MHWRRGHLTTGRARGLFAEILSPGRANLLYLQGAVERLEDLMRRYTQRRDAQSGQRRSLAEDIRTVALQALFPEELERHCQLQRSRLDKKEQPREKVIRKAEARGYVAPILGQVGRAREDKDDPMDVGGFGQGKGRTGKEKGKNPTGKEKEQERMVQNRQDNRHRRRSKDSAGIVGKQVIIRSTAGRSHGTINRTKDPIILPGREKT